MEDETPIFHVRVRVEMVDPLRVEKGSAALDPVNRVSLLDQEICQISSILAGNTRN